MSGSITSALLGSKLRILLTLAVTLGVVVGGGLSMGVLGAPSVAGVQNSFGNVTDETTEIRTDLVVHNPNPVGIELGDVSVSYDVTMNDVAMANGTKKGFAVGTGNSTVTFSTAMDNDRIPVWWASHVRNGERTALRVDATVSSGTLGRSFEAPPVERRISTDVISQFNSTESRPINADQPLVSDPVAYVNETSARWGAVTREETPIAMRFDVYNAKRLPMAITEIGYTITMNDVTVGNGSSDTAHVIEGHTTETVETRTVIENDRLDEWWVSHLRNDQVTQLRIDFYARVEVAGETFRIPLDNVGYEKTIETDIFGTKSQSVDGGTTTGENTSASDGDGSTTTDDSTTSSDTATTTGGETTTDSDDGTTTTDDGLLALGRSGVR